MTSSPAALRVVATLAMACVAYATSAQPPDALRSAWEAATGEARVLAAAELVNFLAHADPEEGVAIAESSLEEAREMGFARGEAALELALGTCLNILARNEEAIEHYERGVDLYTSLDDRKGMIQGLRSIGISHFDTGRPDNALEYYLRALEIAEALDDPIEIGKTASNIGNVYWSTGNFEKALPAQSQALRAFTAADYKLGIAGVSLNIGALYERMADNEDDPAAKDDLLRLALENLERAHLTFSALEIPRGISASLGSRGSLHLRLGNLGQALSDHESALKIRREIDDKVGQVESLDALGSVHERLGNPRRAIESLEEARALATSTGANRPLVSVLESLAGLYERTGRYQDAAEAYRAKAALEDELQSEEMDARIAELDRRFDSEKKARQIEQLQHDQQVAALRLARQKALTTSVALGGALVLLLLSFLWLRYRARVRMAERLDHAARHDALTSLSNRRDMLEKLEYEHRRVRRTGRPAALIIADIDDFKKINDTFGHHAGDAALVRIANLIRGESRTIDVASRWGGEEFLVLLPETDLKGGLVVAEKIRGAIEAATVSTNTNEFPVTATFGVAEADPTGTIEDWVKAADRALLKGKREGKNRVVPA